MAKRPYPKYSKEFKVEAIRLAEESDKPVTQVARELGLRVNQIYK
jgi:transposase